MLQLAELVTELERQNGAKYDIVVPTSALCATSFGAPGHSEMDIVIQGGTEQRGAYGLTEWAHVQLADKLGIPKRYYDRIRGAGFHGLLAENVNAWINEKERRLVRVMDGRIRAFLSDKYKLMDNLPLLVATLEYLKENDFNVDVHRCDLTETRMYVKVVQPYNIAEIREGDKVIPGLMLSNSEVGAGKWKLEPFMLRLLCSNGMIGEEVISRIHLGERMGEGIYSEQTKQLEDELVWSKVRDVIDVTFDDQHFREWVDRLRRGTEVEVESPVAVVENVAVDYVITDEGKRDLMDYFTVKEDPTQWGIANAMTRLAQTQENVDEQIRLERAGNKIGTMEETDFRELSKERKREEEPKKK